MLRNGRNDNQGNMAHFGCSCCNSKRVRRAAKKRLKAIERKLWKKDQQA